MRKTNRLGRMSLRIFQEDSVRVLDSYHFAEESPNTRRIGPFEYDLQLCFASCLLNKLEKGFLMLENKSGSTGWTKRKLQNIESRKGPIFGGFLAELVDCFSKLKKAFEVSIRVLRAGRLYFLQVEHTAALPNRAKHLWTSLT